MRPEPKYTDYAARMYGLRLHNEIGLFYLHSKIIDASNIPKINSIATVQYSRYHDRGVINVRLNYAGRLFATGFQGELETYYTHSKKWYSYAIASYSPDITIFPQLRAGYSINHGMAKGYTAELGVRYLSLSGGKLVSPIVGLSKEINDFYLNLKVYYQQLTYGDSINKDYYSALFSARYYLTENRNDYFTALAGYGNVPDDFSTNYFLSTLATYKTITCGVGYRKQLQYRTTFSINATWYNVKSATTVFRNQYDLYLTLQRRF